MQEKRFNLPIKYGIMPIVRDGKICAFIACKCYLVEHTTKYLKKGVIDSYKVVYYYNDNFKKNYPIFSGETCLNSVEEEIIFDEFERAQRLARVKNNYIALASNDNTINEETYQIYYNLETMLENKSNEANIVDINSYKKSLKK